MAKLLDAAEIDQEVRAVLPASYFETELPDLPLTRLRDRTFEVLAYALSDARIGKDPARFTKVTLLREGADQGRDVLLLHEERVVGVIQCKRYSSDITRPMVLQELMRFALLAKRNPELVPEPRGFLYELWTAGEITGEAQRFFDSPHAWIEANHSAMLGAAGKARSGVVALRCDDEQVEAGENEAAIALVQRFSIRTVGPTEIKARLADNEIVRRRFFRGPSDWPRQARENDIERLLAKFPNGAAREKGRGVGYVPRASLDREFEKFMASPAKIFVVLGGSGQGKSTWAESIRDQPPAAAKIDIVRGDDIHSSDRHIADTIARILRSRPLEGLTSTDLVQAVLEWIYGASRLILIDGVDRVPADTVATLPSWLRRTFAMAADSSTRFVVTSRQAMWALVAPEECVSFADVHTPHGSAGDMFPAIELRPLSREEAAEVYRAYKLPPPATGASFFRIPGLIAREARMRSSERLQLGTRLSVLSEELKTLRRQLQLQAEIGPQEFALLIEVLGEALIEARDGRLHADALRRREPRALRALDAALRNDLAVSEGEGIRIEPDDLTEYLMALRLSPDRARALLDKHGGDLLIGAAALATAHRELDCDETVRNAIATLRDDADHDSPAFAAAARAITELRNKNLVREQLHAILHSWQLPNMALDASPLIRLLNEVDLPAIERLEAAMILAPGEDNWDWRGKYFEDPSSARDRFVTGFGRAAARAVADDAAGALEFLLRLVDEAEASDEGFDHYESVVSGLLYFVIDGAPAIAARIAWAERSTQRKWLLDRVEHCQPQAVAALLGTVLNPDSDRNSAIDRLWFLVSGNSARVRDDYAFLRAATLAASAHLPLCSSDFQVVLLLIIRLLGTPNRDDERRLASLWPHVTDGIFWTALEARTEGRLKLLTERLTEIPVAARPSRAGVLQMLRADLFSVDEWGDIGEVLEAAAIGGLGHSASMALESMLYRAGAQGELTRLMPVARKFASSPDPDVRRPLIYFAGSPKMQDSSAQRAAREELFGLLVKYETGENLGPLVWKLLQSAAIFRSGMQRLTTLCESCGAEKVNEAVIMHAFTEEDGYRLLKDEWDRIPKSDRPLLPEFECRQGWRPPGQLPPETNG